MAARPVARSAGRYSNLTGTLSASPDFLSRLNAALAAVGMRGSIPDPLGGFRTGAQEDHLHATESGRVGTSSTSMHVFGWASDVIVGGRPIRDMVPDSVLARFGLIAPYADDTVHVEDRRGLSWAKKHAFSPRNPATLTAWQPCLLTWYDPALGGTNSGSGRADPHSATASGEPYSAAAFTCAAPASFPFGTKVMFKYRGRTVTCRVNDRGGAIVGAHFDLSRAAANSLGIINAGSVHAEYAEVGGGQSAGAGSGVTRPGGTAAEDDGAGLEALYQSFLDEGRQGDTAFASFTQAAGAKGVASRFISFPGIGPTPPIPDIPGLPGFDPFDIFKQGINAIKTTKDLLKLIGWIFNPRNILRVVEFLVGVSLIYTAIRIHLRVFMDSASEKPGRIFGGKRKSKRGGRGRSGRGGQRGVQGAPFDLRIKGPKRSASLSRGSTPKPKPKPKQLGTGSAGGAAGSSGKLASAASKVKTVVKAVPK